MNLRRRFTVLVVGSVLTPFVAGFLVAALFGRFPNTEDRPSHADVVKIYRFFETSADVDTARQVLQQLPDRALWAIVTSDGTILDSRGWGEGVLTDDTSPSGYNLMVKALKPDGQGRDVYILLATEDSREGMLVGLSVLVLLILVFTTTVATLTIRSIRGTLAKLEEATSAIATGKLDVRIPIEENDSFYPLARSVEIMADRIKQEYDRRNRFFMGVSHDLKTPLTSITGYSQALLDHMSDDPEAQQRYAGIIRDKAQVLQNRIHQLMEYIRLATGEFQTRLDKQDLTAFLEDFAAVHLEEAGFTGRNLRVHIGLESETRLPFDPDLLARALENLLTNAYQHGISDDEVVLTAEKGDGEIRIACANRVEPAGTEDTNLDRLFDPFYRRDNARRGEGFGLGLASAKSIVDSHGWTLEASMPTGDTVEFAIHIPVSS